MLQRGHVCAFIIQKEVINDLRNNYSLSFFMESRFKLCCVINFTRCDKHQEIIFLWEWKGNHSIFKI